LQGINELLSKPRFGLERSLRGNRTLEAVAKLKAHPVLPGAIARGLLNPIADAD
jgi:hypothetical protein